MKSIETRNLCISCRRRAAEPRALYCAECKHQRAVACIKRPQSVDRGRRNRQKNYAHEWRQIRKQILNAHGIPIYMHKLYDVHHDPPYNPEIEPDHRKYTLTPKVRQSHKSHTASRQKRDKNGRFAK